MDYNTFYFIIAIITLLTIIMILLYNNISYDIKINNVLHNKNTNTNTNTNEIDK